MKFTVGRYILIQLSIARDFVPTSTVLDKNSLRFLPWDVLDDLHVNDAVELFYRWTETAISEHIPTVTMKTRYPPWFHADVKRALREKERAHFLKKHSPNDMHAEQFSASRTRFKNIVLSKYRRYEGRLISSWPP